ncbi:sugar phosphate nucleotidyltransferase [Marinomonas gallaica]|uniref:sugar phosphate nucleotidyltransferase n=1 Tax=Marinomonas gallaica TaxID=1806667 RepID=UPI00082CF642|nr:sugar phosphate nucleotidyltransferase [Marinomonas gallaica]
MVASVKIPPLIVLAGGLGTRLRSVVADKPKILAPIGQHPYLYHLITWAQRQGIEEMHFCLGYKANQVIDWLKSCSLDMSFSWQVEQQQLGTGGALVEALKHPMLAQRESVLVCNGDTFVDFSVAEFIAQARTHSAILTTSVVDAGRYGRILKDSTDQLVEFLEKDSQAGPGEINAGWYHFSGDNLASLRNSQITSLEKDFLMASSPQPLICVCIGQSFLDFGTPESYQAAQTLFKDAL